MYEHGNIGSTNVVFWKKYSPSLKVFVASSYLKGSGNSILSSQNVATTRRTKSPKNLVSFFQQVDTDHKFGHSTNGSTTDSRVDIGTSGKVGTRSTLETTVDMVLGLCSEGCSTGGTNVGHTPYYSPIQGVLQPSEEEVLEAIARCESGGRQFNDDGTVIRGKVNPQDTGKFQINKFYHGKRAQELGMDLETLEGNTAYAEVLYREQGTKPWGWSKKCHGY